MPENLRRFFKGCLSRYILSLNQLDLRHISHTHLRTPQLPHLRELYLSASTLSYSTPASVKSKMISWLEESLNTWRSFFWHHFPCLSRRFCRSWRLYFPAYNLSRSSSASEFALLKFCLAHGLLSAPRFLISSSARPFGRSISNPLLGSLRQWALSSLRFTLYYFWPHPSLSPNGWYLCLRAHRTTVDRPSDSPNQKMCFKEPQRHSESLTNRIAEFVSFSKREIASISDFGGVRRWCFHLALVAVPQPHWRQNQHDGNEEIERNRRPESIYAFSSRYHNDVTVFKWSRTTKIPKTPLYCFSKPGYHGYSRGSGTLPIISFAELWWSPPLCF